MRACSLRREKKTKEKKHQKTIHSNQAKHHWQQKITQRKSKFHTPERIYSLYIEERLFTYS